MFGQVGDPQAVPPAVFGLEQGQLGAWVGPLSAGEDAHRGGPAVQLIPGPAMAQQRRQLGDVRFFPPACAVRAPAVSAGVLGAALAHLAAVIDGDLPGLLRYQPDRGALAFAQFPADGVDELVAGPGGQPIQALEPPERQGQRGDRRAQHLQVIGGGVGPGAPGPQRGGQRLAGVVAPAAQRVQAFSELNDQGIRCPGRYAELRKSGLRSGLLAGGEDRRGGDGPAGGLGEGWHAQVDGGGLAGDEFAHLGELGGRGGEADFESFDSADPAVLLGLGDAVVQVVADVGKAGPLGWVGPQEGTADAAFSELDFRSRADRLTADVELPVTTKLKVLPGRVWVMVAVMGFCRSIVAWYSCPHMPGPPRDGDPSRLRPLRLGASAVWISPRTDPGYTAGLRRGPWPGCRARRCAPESAGQARDQCLGCRRSGCLARGCRNGAPDATVRLRRPADCRRSHVRLPTFSGQVAAIAAGAKAWRPEHDKCRIRLVLLVPCLAFEGTQATRGHPGLPQRRDREA